LHGRAPAAPEALDTPKVGDLRDITSTNVLRDASKDLKMWSGALSVDIQDAMGDQHEVGHVRFGRYGSIDRHVDIGIRAATGAAANSA
jgi:hypothetical protein